MTADSRISIIFRLFVLTNLLLSSAEGAGQVANDNISARLQLRVGDLPFQSKTNDCTVERQCIDKRLEGNCVDFHNDQWFWFTTSRAGKYYVNLSGQRCRDQKGLQLMVIDGVPCKTDTYQVLQCISLANQDDVYAELELPQANHLYLLNVDGYLGDFCDFQIQVSQTPKGLPLQTLAGPAVPLTGERHENRLLLRWQLSPALVDQITGFQVYRWFTKLPTSAAIATIPAAFSSRGGDQAEYQIEDTLRQEGRYQYKIVAVTSDSSRVLIGQHWEVYQEQLSVEEQTDTHLLLNLDFKPKTPLQLLIMDAQTDQVLKSITFTYTDAHKQFTYDVSKFKQQGIYRYKVQVINLNTRQSSQYYISK